MEKVKCFKHTVFGGEMTVSEFAMEVLTLVNYMSSRKGTIIDIKTMEGTNNVTVCSYKNIEKDLKSMFNATEVATYPLNVYFVEGLDLGKDIAKEMDCFIYEKDEEILVTSMDLFED